MIATLIHPDGTIEEVMPDNGKQWTLEELQAHIGGYIEIHPSPDGEKVAVINEEGLLEGLPQNIAGTGAAYWMTSLLMPPGGLVGPVLITSTESIA